jgi:hypothetical protein
MESIVSRRRSTLDRRRRSHFVLRDRRTGFDRRRPQGQGSLGAAFESALIHLRDNPSSLVSLLVLANLLSLLDLALTLTLLRLGVVEANPIMRHLFAASTGQAIAVKAGLIAAASIVIWALRTRRPALMAALFMVTLYAAIVFYEVVGFAHLV